MDKKNQAVAAAQESKNQSTATVPKKVDSIKEMQEKLSEAAFIGTLSAMMECDTSLFVITHFY